MIETQTIVADDGFPLVVHHQRVIAPRAIIIVVHDLRDHAGRQVSWMRRLAKSGIAIFAFDMRGHGRTSSDIDRGMVEPRPVWDTLVSDIGRVRRHAVTESGVKPVFLIGQGAGADLVHSVAQAQGRQYAGILLIGPGHIGTFSWRLMRLLLTIEQWRQGPTAAVVWIDDWHARIYRRRERCRHLGQSGNLPSHPLAWRAISAQPVKDYAADPLCGGVLRLKTLAGVTDGAARTRRCSRRLRLRPELPILILAGRQDPAGNYGRLPKRLARNLVNDGCRDVSTRCYAGAGHDLLFEPVGNDVIADMVDWISRRVRI